MGQHLARIASSVALAYGCYLALCFFAQRFIIYPGLGFRAPATPPAQSTGITRLQLETPFGRTEAWFLAGEGSLPERRPVVLFFHGNGEIIDSLPAQVEGFRRIGSGVLL